MWPALTALKPDPSTWWADARIAAAVLTAFGCCAAAFAAIDDPVGRRRGLLGFGHAHVMLGAMLIAQSVTTIFTGLPALVAWSPLVIGIVLLYLAVTGPGADLRPALTPLRPDGTRPLFVVRNKPALAHLRSRYEEQIRLAARQEERARLARDLHDAVKQQLFVIQTAAATAQARFDSDGAGARAAVEQVRGAAREAMAEMEALLDQLQAVPIENAGLVAFLNKQCEALGFRTGAQVTFEPGLLPDPAALDPGARMAIARVAQEALSNVARHSRARHVAVSLHTTDGRLILTVKDDGSGFARGGPPRGMGMAGMAARAAETGGSLDVVSMPGNGTTLRFAVPCLPPTSPRPYVVRAAVWGVVFSIAFRFMLSRGIGARPWLVPIAAIAAIAVARYAVAAYHLYRPRPAV